jgi:hypothetical protein
MASIVVDGERAEFDGRSKKYESESGMFLCRNALSFIVFTIKMSHRPGLIGQQTEIVLVILNLFFDVLEFADHATTAIT